MTNVNLATHQVRADSIGETKPLPMSVVERADIPSITSVVIDGAEHQLGIVKDFRKHEAIARFLPEVPERVSFSWVRLLPGEVLAVHSHPTASLILVCDGEGYCTGDVTKRMESGSTVMVPPNCLHGFCGAGEHGFWALSIQLESLGLYEDLDNARVSFDNQAHQGGADLQLLLNAQAFFMEDFKRNAFFQLCHSERINRPQVLERFLDNIQHFSTKFQSILRVRLDHAQCEIERELAQEHLEEEQGHDTNFAKLRGKKEPSYIDPQMPPLMDWFEDQMRTLSDAEKIVLMHLVLEGSGELAHTAVYDITADTPVGEHFRLHKEEDDGHTDMGINALRKLPDLNIEQLLTIAMTGWSKINQLCERFAKSANPNQSPQESE